MSKVVYLGIDVGTSSVRCLAVSKCGITIGSECEPLLINHYDNDIFEQSSDQIWSASCAAVKRLLHTKNINPEDVKGIGYDATCSLVALDKNGNAINVSMKQEEWNKWNIIMWMDHRAKQQANTINETKDEALDQVGGAISPEMQLPKLLWIKENLSDTWQNADHYMDLTDFMTYKSTGSLKRSLCTVVCKWLYNASNEELGWRLDFLTKIGLKSLGERNCHKIGDNVGYPGSFCGNLTKKAADALGLSSGTPVATGIIDAHSGVLATVACKDNQGGRTPACNILSMICGTSTCHMALSEQPIQVHGIWGPYFGAVLPNIWLNEAGQSAVGSVLDTLLKPFKSNHTNTEMHKILCCQYIEYVNKEGALKAAQLAEDIDVWPDYHGNRSPLANPKLRGAILGLTMDFYEDLNSILPLYIAHNHAMAYMTRYIMEKLQDQGHKFSAITLCGGLQNNHIYVQSHADILNCPLLLPECEQPVSLGAAMLGAHASGDFESMMDTMEHFAPKTTTIFPCSQTKQYHERKYLRFRKLGQFMQEFLE